MPIPTLCHRIAARASATCRLLDGRLTPAHHSTGSRSTLTVSLCLPPPRMIAAKRAHVGKIPAPAEHHVLVPDQDAVGRIDVHPTMLGTHPAADPGMRLVAAAPLRLAGRRLRADVTTDVAGGQTQRAQAGDHQMGESPGTRRHAGPAPAPPSCARSSRRRGTRSRGRYASFRSMTPPAPGARPETTARA